jgi:hypothetical protein
VKQEDSATCHTAWATVAPTIAELVTTRHFQWDCIKDASNPGNLDEVTANISNITADISPMALQAVSTDMLCRARLCMQHAGVHFQNFWITKRTVNILLTYFQ